TDLTPSSGPRTRATLGGSSNLSILIFSRMSSLMFVCDCLRRTRPRVQIAKAAIAGDHVRDTFFYRAVLAVPVHVPLEAYYCAPGGITISSAGRSSEPGCRSKGSDTNRQFRKGFGHDDSSLDFLCLL